MLESQFLAMTKRYYILKASAATLKLYNEDCIAGMRRRLMPSSIDVVVTSPPYNLGIRYGAYDDSLSRSEYLDWIEQWTLAISSLLCPDGSLFLNVGSKPSDPLVPFQVLERVQRHLRLQNVIHWIKSIAIEKQDAGAYPNITGDISVGHYKPINSPRFLNDCHEYVFHFTHAGDVQLDRLAIGVPYQDKSNVRRWANAQNDLRCRGNTWFVPYETIHSRSDQRPHPATFPVKLVEMCLRLHGTENTQLVLDPFLGIGQSALAALNLGLDFIGFEIDKQYFLEACRRAKQRARQLSAEP